MKYLNYLYPFREKSLLWYNYCHYSIKFMHYTHIKYDKMPLSLKSCFTLNKGEYFELTISLNRYAKLFRFYFIQSTQVKNIYLLD